MTARPLAFVTRRRVLQLGLGAGALALLGGGGLLWLRGAAPAIHDLKCLSPQQFRTLAAMARTHIPAGGPFAIGADEAELARAFDRYLADEPPGHVRDVKRALHLVEFGPILFDRRLTTFSHLPPADQRQHWLAWGQSDLLLRRQVWWGFAKFFGLVFYDRPEVWPHIGYPGPSLERLPA